MDVAQREEVQTPDRSRSGLDYRWDLDGRGVESCSLNDLWKAET